MSESLIDAGPQMSEAEVSEAGEERAFKDFFESQYPRLVRGLAFVLADGSDAEDIAQEAFVRVLERWARVETMRLPEGYLFRVAFNLSKRRRFVTYALQPFDKPVDGGNGSGGFEGDSIVRADMLKAVRCLKPRYRDPLVLRDWFELSYDDCSKVLRIAPTSVRVRVHRARSQLRDLLGGAYGQE